jgi:hypothetical protein
MCVCVCVCARARGDRTWAGAQRGRTAQGRQCQRDAARGRRRARRARGSGSPRACGPEPAHGPHWAGWPGARRPLRTGARGGAGRGWRRHVHRTSMVQKGKLLASAARLWVSALKSVLLPTLGTPTIPAASVRRAPCGFTDAVHRRSRTPPSHDMLDIDFTSVQKRVRAARGGRVPDAAGRAGPRGGGCGRRHIRGQSARPRRRAGPAPRSP